MALQNYLEIPVLIEYVDASPAYKSDGKTLVPRRTIKLPEMAKEEDIFVNLLFVPGHYEILYKNK